MAMVESEMMSLDVPYRVCKLAGSHCSDGNCKMCIMPMVMREETRQTIIKAHTAGDDRKIFQSRNV